MASSKAYSAAVILASQPRRRCQRLLQGRDLEPPASNLSIVIAARRRRSAIDFDFSQSAAGTGPAVSGPARCGKVYGNSTMFEILV